MPGRVAAFLRIHTYLTGPGVGRQFALDHAGEVVWCAAAIEPRQLTLRSLAVRAVDLRLAGPLGRPAWRHVSFANAPGRRKTPRDHDPDPKSDRPRELLPIRMPSIAQLSQLRSGAHTRDSNGACRAERARAGVCKLKSQGRVGELVAAWGWDRLWRRYLPVGGR